MRQRGDGLRLALESGEAFGIGGDRSRQDLDRDVAIEARVAGAIHLAHTAGAERLQDLVAAEAVPAGRAMRG